MKRVLLVAYWAPPRSGVATLRTRHLLRYLPEFGWDVTLFTASGVPAERGAAYRTIQTPNVDVQAGVKRFLGISHNGAHAALGVVPAEHEARPSWRQRIVEFGYRATSYPDPQVGWLLPGISALGRAVRAERFDAILSSAPPVTSNLMVAAGKHGVPWVADVRDLWTGSDQFGTWPIRRAADETLERLSLTRASALTTVSEPIARYLARRFQTSSVTTISNAFDEAEWDGIPFATESRCTFLYAGQLFGGRRDPRPLFAAIRALLDEGKLATGDIAVDIYSPEERWLHQAVATYRLEQIVRVFGFVDRQTVLQAERRADRLVVLLWDGLGAESVVTGKLFEYFGARRPVLAIGGPADSAVDGVLAASGAGVRCTSHDALKREVLQAVEEHRAGNVRRLSMQQLESFGARSMAGRFAGVLDGTVR
ncbi:MAG: glycosyltransferase [Candidatus Eremiobacteraeota bacterium]|nr:glycosyltransferase [Candidatus Eremiobacteraeota bacterium]